VPHTDKSVSGSVTITGIAGTAAHIHEGATGKNGLVIIPLTKNGGTDAVPTGAKLTDAQFASFQSGNLTSTSTRRRIRVAKCARNWGPDIGSWSSNSDGRRELAKVDHC
jgi:hypothetical protein